MGIVGHPCVQVAKTNLRKRFPSKGWPGVDKCSPNSGCVGGKEWYDVTSVRLSSLSVSCYLFEVARGSKSERPHIIEQKVTRDCISSTGCIRGMFKGDFYMYFQNLSNSCTSG